MHRTRTLKIIIVHYNAKKQWLEWQFNVVLAEVICVAKISSFNNPKNDLIRIPRFPSRKRPEQHSDLLQSGGKIRVK